MFVTGTDTGVGKTRVATLLVRALRARGIDVGVMKPCETGVGPEGPLDAIALSAAAGHPDRLDVVCPVHFALPAAPNVAARAEGRRIDLAAIDRAFRDLAASHDFMVVEGAGGLLVPTEPPATMADLAAEWALPLLVVARASLGTINHTLLTLAEIERRRLVCAGVVVSHAGGRLSDADAANLAHLVDRLGDGLVGEIPFLDPGDSTPPDALDVDAILRACGTA